MQNLKLWIKKNKNPFWKYQGLDKFCHFPHFKEYTNSESLYKNQERNLEMHLLELSSCLACFLSQHGAK